MQETRVSLPELALIAGTRVALGAGLGLLLSNRLDRSLRVAIGLTLVAVGAITTVPLAFEVLNNRRRSTNGHSKPAPRPDVTEGLMAD